MSGSGAAIARAIAARRRGDILADELQRERNADQRESALDLLEFVIRQENLRDIIGARRRDAESRRAAVLQQQDEERQKRAAATFLAGQIADEALKEQALSLVESNPDEAIRFARNQIDQQQKIELRDVQFSQQKELRGIPQAREFAPREDTSGKDEQKRRGEIIKRARSMLDDQGVINPTDEQFFQAMQQAQRQVELEERFFEQPTIGDTQRLRGTATQLTLQLAELLRERGRPEQVVEQGTIESLNVIARLEEAGLRQLIARLQQTLGSGQ